MYQNLSTTLVIFQFENSYHSVYFSERWI